jgi:phosphoserine phosphatase
VNLICFDCDSTLSAIEGVDELARARGPQVFAEVEAMTNDAMNGLVPLEAVFGRRLSIIRPRRQDAEAVARRYIEEVEPTARATVAALAEAGWSPLIVSGGFTPAVRPLAEFLGISRVEAVDLYFTAEGDYAGYDEGYPTTRSAGKAEVIQRLRRELQPERVVMVGDGVSDLEARPVVDRFVGYGGYVTRERVKKEACAFIHSLADLGPLLKER